MIGEEIAGPLNPRQREYAQLILRSSGTLLTIINDILDLASIDNDELQLEREQTSVADLVGESLPGVPVALGFLEVIGPTIAEALAQLAAAGCRTVVAAPLLLFEAGHAKRDVPEAIAEPAAALGIVDRSRGLSEPKLASRPGTPSDLDGDAGAVVLAAAATAAAGTSSVAALAGCSSAAANCMPDATALA